MKNAAELGRMLSELETEPMPADDGVDADEFVATLRAAVSARNGWKRIRGA